MSRRTPAASASMVFLTLLVFLVSPAPGHAATETAQTALYRLGHLRLEAGLFEEAAGLFARAWEADRANKSATLWHMRLSFYQGQLALSRREHAAALAHFRRALDLKKRLTPVRDSEQAAIQRYLELTPEHARYCTGKPQYVFRILVLSIMHTELKDIKDHFGKPVTGRGSMHINKDTLATLGQEMFKFHIEALTRGRLSVTFDNNEVDTTLTRAEWYARQKHRTMFRPDWNSTSDSLGPLFFAGRNTYDAFFFYFINKNFQVWPHANGVPTIYHPYTWYGPSRPSVVMPMGGGGRSSSNALRISRLNNAWVLLHEFFHVVERISGGIGPQHGWEPAYRQQARQRYPDWVPDPEPAWTITEYSWYRYHLLHTVPRQMEKKAKQSGLYPPFRNFSFVLTRPDRTGDHLFRTYTGAMRGISLDNLRLAAEAFKQAQRAKTQDAVIALYNKTLQHNPCHHQALEGLGRLMLQRGDIPAAERHFTKLAAVFPDPEKLFAIGMDFFRTNDFPRAARFFGMTAALPNTTAACIIWQYRALTRAGNTAEAARVRARLAADPVFTSPQASLHALPSGLGLYAATAPDSTRPPFLARPLPREGAVWHIAPSGEAGYVLLVSAPNWRCLAAGGASARFPLQLVALAAGDSCKWRLVADGDGHRLISKQTGLALGLAPGSRTKLAPVAPAAALRWKIGYR